MVKTYQKIHSSLIILGPFSCNSWVFDMHNTDRLRNLMSEDDRKIYYFDMASLDWTEYFQSALWGMRLYLGKEAPTPESLAKGLKRIKR